MDDLQLLQHFRTFREALAKDIAADVRELRAGEWLDQTHSPLGRNRHVRCAKRRISEGKADALHTGGLWLLTRAAIDQEIARINAEEPPRALRLAKTEPEPESDNDTGVYERQLLERVSRK